mmetsp:Transcript_16161/g.39370  ORF Transcript_16161/g.39370 Transcript_16161/m.39370 type:complete len:249 (-) Transcript_16161:293-1039(-)
MFQTKMHPSSPTETSCLSSGLNWSELMHPECPAPSISSEPRSKSKTRRIWSFPPHATKRPECESTQQIASSGRLTALMGSVSLRSQYVSRRSCPTEITCTWSWHRAISLTPPILCRRLATRFSCRRSHERTLRSRLAVRACASSSKTQMLVTARLCSFMCATISRILTSHTLTSPCSPPVTMNLLLCETASAVTPPLCTSGIFHSASPVSASKHLTCPSDQPERRHSRAKARQCGRPPSLHIPLQSTR